MDRLDSQTKPSIYAEKAYQLILSGVNQFQSEEDQHLFLNSLLCQCAVFARLLEGRQAFEDLLDRLKTVDVEAAFEEAQPVH